MSKQLNGHSDPTDSNRAAINRANAQHSTGPITPEGKARSSMNALKHGLTAKAITLPAEDLAEFARYVQTFMDDYKPRGATEKELIETIADLSWRLKRISKLERQIIPTENSTVDEALTLEVQRRALATYGMNAQRFYRARENAIRQLAQLQEVRRVKEMDAMFHAVALYKMHTAEGDTFNPADDGFVFSLEEVETYIRRYNRLRAAA